MGGSTFFVIVTTPSRGQQLMPMQYAECLKRKMTEMLYDNQPVAPQTPEKPPYINDEPHQPREGQVILTD